MGSVSDLLDAGHRLAELVANYEDKLKVLELAAKAADLQAENDDLQSKVRELRGELLRKKRLETIAGASCALEDDGSRTGPVCKRCYDEKGLTIRLVRWYGKGAHCANCGTVYPGIESGIDGPKAQRVSWWPSHSFLAAAIERPFPSQGENGPRTGPVSYAITSTRAAAWRRGRARCCSRGFMRTEEKLRCICGGRLHFVRSLHD